MNIVESRGVVLHFLLFKVRIALQALGILAFMPRV